MAKEACMQSTPETTLQIMETKCLFKGFINSTYVKLLIAFVAIVLVFMLASIEPGKIFKIGVWRAAADTHGQVKRHTVFVMTGGCCAQVRHSHLGPGVCQPPAVARGPAVWPPRHQV